MATVLPVPTSAVANAPATKVGTSWTAALSAVSTPTRAAPVVTTVAFVSLSKALFNAVTPVTVMAFGVIEALRVGWPRL